MNKPREFIDYPFKAATHEAVLPPMHASMDVTRHPVAIVGGGPVGYALALGLANYGVRSVVIEQDASVCYGSRAICISRRSLQIMERLGALDSFLDKGLPWTGGRSFYRNTEVLHFEMPHDEEQKLPPMLNIEQFYIEQFLLDAVEKRADLIDVRWGTTVKGVTNTLDGAVLDLETAAGNYKLAANWLVACDGGRSFVREALGLQLKGTSYEGRYVIVDILLRSALPTGRLAWFDPPSNPGSSILMHKQPDDVWRIDYQLGPDEDPEEAIKPENVIPRVQQHLDMIGETQEWSPIWITIYKAHALTLDSYVHGRTLFAGDAAHLMPIFGVRGANSGIDDADNLSWKLAAVINGVAAPDLLQTYSGERVFAAHENLKHGSKSTEFMTPPTFAFELMRKAVLTLALKDEGVRPLINPRQSSTISYNDSTLRRSEDDVGEFGDAPAPGNAIGEGRVRIVTDSDEYAGHLSDLLKTGFNVLCFTDQNDVDEEISATISASTSAAMPVNLVRITRQAPRVSNGAAGWDEHGALFQQFHAVPGTCYLVRPDGYVLGRWAVCRASQIQSALSTALQLEQETV